MKKTIVITGAGGILCSAFARELAKAGANMALLDINEPAGNSLAQEIIDGGGNAKYYPVNVLEKSSLEAAHAKILQDFGPCEVLINGAGGNSPKCTTTEEIFDAESWNAEGTVSFFDLEQSGFDFVFGLNLTGIILPAQIFAQDMIGKKGCSILNISSMNAYRPLTKIPAYSAAKAAVSNFTQWLAVHFAKTGIRVNAIAPGFFLTNQNRTLLFDEQGKMTKRSEKIIGATPMGRFGEPEELLGTLDWLIDETRSGFVTGVIVPVDGGFSAYSGV